MTTVFFESFYGRVVGDNPRAIDAALTAVRPELTRYWSIASQDIPVPAGAIGVIEGTAEWHRARSSARLLVVNDWLRHDFTRRPGQHVLQTWHGTPLKRLALSRRTLAPRRRLAAIKESHRWSILLAQNLYAARELRRAYAFRGPVWVEGYPRNDFLVTGDRAAVRESLGLDADARVLLYAPTWRDDRTTMVDFLDPDRLARETDSTVLIRAHSRTPPAPRPPSDRVMDVTAHADAAALMLAADALITDYSSVMFDFPITGRPMHFFIPDLAHYTRVNRGLLFDLFSRAPGSVTRTQAELTAAITGVPDSAIAARYDAFRRRFAFREDGHAADRVVRRILDQRLLDPEF